MTRVCVFTGSSLGTRPAYGAAARELARACARRSIAVTYGGARVGLMGILADETLAAGGDVVGVIPQALVDKEVAHAGLPDLRVVGSMHERKALMSELSDGFIAMPGGLGTLEELFEVLTWSQLGLHGKPCGLLNVEGFFDRLMAFIDHAVSEGFLRAEHRAMVVVASAADDLLDQMARWEPPRVAKWIDSEAT